MRRIRKIKKKNFYNRWWKNVVTKWWLLCKVVFLMLSVTIKSLNNNQTSLEDSDSVYLKINSIYLSFLLYLAWLCWLKTVNHFELIRNYFILHDKLFLFDIKTLFKNILYDWTRIKRRSFFTFQSPDSHWKIE